MNSSILLLCMCISVFARTQEGTIIYLETDPSHTIEQIKSMIKEKKGVPTDAMVLMFGKVLLDNRQNKLSDYSIQNGAALQLRVLSK